MNFKILWDNFSDVFGGTYIHPQYFIKVSERKSVQKLKVLAKGVFLDIGCGRQWYRGVLEPRVEKYYALDHPRVSKRYKSSYPVELKSDASRIPLSDNSVDLANMIMVLEHLPEPDKALVEIRRVLKPGRKLLVCTVENYPGHDLPYNYYHFTKFGLREIFKEAGFRIEKMESFGNFWESQVVFQNVFLMQYVKKLVFRKSTVIFGVLFFIVFFPVMVFGNILALVLGRRTTVEEFALAHIVIASKD